MASRLKVLKSTSKVITPAERRWAAVEKYNQLWKSDPEQFNPERSAEGRERIRRSWELLKPYFKAHMTGVDLGVGYGTLTYMCAQAGAHMTAVDIAEEALQGLNNIHTEMQYLPYTTLPDNNYHLVIATEIIAELHETEYRLFFSELARIIHPEGYLLISTQLDIYSEGALERFLSYMSTEFTIEGLRLSYHALFIKLQRLLPLIKNSDWLLQKLEKLTQFFYQREGISHVILIGKRRPLFEERA